MIEDYTKIHGTDMACSFVWVSSRQTNLKLRICSLYNWTRLDESYEEYFATSIHPNVAEVPFPSPLGTGAGDNTRSGIFPNCNEALLFSLKEHEESEWCEMKTAWSPFEVNTGHYTKGRFNLVSRNSSILRISDLDRNFKTHAHLPNRIGPYERVEW